MPIHDLQDAAKMPWTAHYPPGVPEDIRIDDEPLTAAFERCIANYPERPCIEFLGKRWTYLEIGDLVDRMAASLKAMGVGKGVNVGLLLPNCPYFVISYYAVLKAGGVVVNFNPLYAREEVTRQIRDSESRIMITLDLKMLLPKAIAALGDSPLERIIVGNLPAQLPFPKSLLFRLFKRREISPVPDNKHIRRLEEVLQSPGEPPLESRPEPGDVAVLQYTGGTTGVPKGAMLTHRNLVANASQIESWFVGVERGQERILGVLPLFHVFAMTTVMNLAMRIGAEMILLPRFELTQVLKTIDRLRPTTFPVVPTLLNAIQREPKLGRYHLKSLKSCISGGAPLPVEIKQEFEAHTHCTVVEGYGLSETSPVVCCNPIVGVNKAGSIGMPIPGTIVEIRGLDDPDKRMAPGERGEVCIYGPQVMSGYWRRPDETARTVRSGWLHSGDVGYMDEDGYVFLVDRLKDVIICGGYNVYPRNIEEAIYTHEAVAEVTVIGIPDDYRGQSAKAFIVVKAGKSLSIDELSEFLKDKISPIEMPREFEFRDSLPKTMIGKLSKKELVAEEAAKRTASKAPASTS